MKTLKIKKIRTGNFYDVEYVENLRNEKDVILRGKIWYGDDLIQINKDFPLSVQLKTLHHESTHGIFEEAHFDGEEDEVAMFSKAFFTFIIDNPEFIKAILEYGERMKE